MVIEIQVKTKSSKSEIQKTEDGFVAYIHSIPNKGKANEELIKLLSEYFGTSKSNIEILKGHKSKHKTVSIV